MPKSIVIDEIHVHVNVPRRLRMLRPLAPRTAGWDWPTMMRQSEQRGRRQRGGIRGERDRS
jgi:hypothetical protein